MAITMQSGKRFVGRKDDEYFVCRQFRYTTRPDGEYVFIHGAKASAEVFCEHNAPFLASHGYALEEV